MVETLSDLQTVNITVQYLKLHNHNDCIGDILKGCAIYSVTRKPFDICCAIPTIFCRLWVVLCKIHSVCSGLPHSKQKNDRCRKCLVWKWSERIYSRMCRRIQISSCIVNVKFKEYSNRQRKKTDTYAILRNKYPRATGRRKQRGRNKKIIIIWLAKPYVFQ
jgi:hypothetical protein